MAQLHEENQKEEKVIVGGVYEHYKKKAPDGLPARYKVLALAKHSETLEDMIVYEAQYQNTLSKTWVRPAAMFAGVVSHDGRNIPRFRLILCP